MLIKPDRFELNYRKELHENKNTMQFQNRIDTVTKEDLDQLYNDLQNENTNEHLYRQIYCDECGFQVGEAGWDIIDGNAYIFLLVAYDLREGGYGESALKELEDLAKEHNINSFYISLEPTNPYISFFTKRGFKQTESNVYSKDIH